MKLKITIIIAACSYSAQAQGTFQNLDFESANIPSSTTGPFVPVSEALPGWVAYFTSGGIDYPQTQVGYDAISTGGNVISLVDSKVTIPLQGNYSVILFGGGNNPYYSASISQTGTMPAGTASLRFSAWSPVGSTVSPIIAIDGQSISVVPLQTFANYTVYGGNIPSTDVGQPETLSFTEPPEPPTGGQPSMFELDNISFSPSAVAPEPSPLALTVLGALLFALHRRLAPKRHLRGSASR